MKSFSLFILAAALTGCARIQTLNLQPHFYSERPDHIVWIQVAGFAEGHIPLLKFNVADANYKTNLEQVDCLGKMWNYNLYELRPEASRSFLSQLTGSKNIKGTCEDFQNTPVWSFLDDINYKGSILENAGSSQALIRALECPGSKTLDLTKIRYYRMSASSAPSQKLFHYQDSFEQMMQSLEPGLYYDRSCQKESCYSSLSNNFKVEWNLLIKDRAKTFFLVRDFNFQNALKKKDVALAKEALQEIDKIVAEVKKNEEGGDTLLIISGAESMPLDFPLQGKEWAEFEKTGKNLYYKNPTLMSPVLVAGPMAENFCGIFDEAEMLKRVMLRPEGKKFHWDSVNPF